jgi:hypothetical protein
MPDDDLANLCRELAALSATIAERDRRMDEAIASLREHHEHRLNEITRRMVVMDEKRDAIGLQINAASGNRAGVVSAWTWLAGAIAAIATLIIILDRVAI